MQQIFNNQYQVQKKISSGSFGVVLLGLDKLNNRPVAIKIEKEDNEEVKSFDREIKILNRLAGTDGIPKMYWHGEQDDYNVIVIQCLGKDLAYYMKNKRKFTIKTVLQLGIKLLRGLEKMHEKGVVHRDLKPENLLLGLDEESQKLYIVDFGISKIYRDANNNIIPFRDKTSFIGTTRYASIAAHKGYEISRKDDLESMIYILLYFAKGQLPWQNMQNVSDEERTQKVGEMKQGIDTRDLCKECPIELAMILEYVRALSYKSNPDYDFIEKLFHKAADQNGIILDEYYDWDKQSTSARKISTSVEKLPQEAQKGQEAQKSQDQQKGQEKGQELRHSRTLQNQNSLQIPDKADMKKSVDKSQLMRQSSNVLLAPPNANNVLQPPLKRQDSRQQTISSAQGSMQGSVMLSTYNSMRPKYQSSQCGKEEFNSQQLIQSQESQLQQTQKKDIIGIQKQDQQQQQNNQTETLGYKESIFDENFDECPLFQKYNYLKNHGVKVQNRHLTPIKKSRHK